MTEAYIGIGSNVGDRAGYIGSAIKRIDATPDIKVEKVSPTYETDPVGGPPQGKFLNGVVKIETTLSARQLMDRLLEVEGELGRKRDLPNGPRVIDLDILTYGDLRIEEDGLVIPHPRMNEREFVLRPLADIKGRE
jgi:2-amino-4-hydroxy-6-hydroxymethyldihydropteridine diphosphokinase